MRLRRLLAPTAVLVAVLIRFAPVLAGRVYRFEDIADYFEPLWGAASRLMRAGRMPLWDGGAWSGFPVLSDPQVGVFYPPNWLWLALPVLRAYAWSVLLHAAWAGLGMYVLARSRDRSPEASALAGIALGVGGYVVLQVRHVMFVEATAWLPWVAAAGWRWLRTRDREALAATAAATGMLLLTGGVSMIYFGALFLAALLVPEALRVPENRVSKLGGLALAGALGGLLAAPALVPAWVHLALSPRALGADEAFAGSVAWSGLHLLPSLFVPNLLGQQVRGNYVGGGTQWEVAGYYAGMATFALALYALVRGPRERRGERLALGSLIALAVLLAPGARSPLFALACRLLPGYASMRCPPRALYVYALAAPLLAADGLDLLAERLRRKGLVRALAPALVALDLLWFQRAENPSTTLAAARARAFPPAARFLVENRGDRFVNDVHLDHALHNAGLLWGLDGASGYDSLPLWRYVHLLWIANHGAPYPHPKLHDDLSAQGLWRFSSPIVDALNVRWVLAPKAPEGRGFALRVPPGPDGIGVWENLEALPRGWVVHRALVVDGEPAAARAVARAAFDPRHEVVLERAPSLAPVMPAEESGAANPDEGFDGAIGFAQPETGDSAWDVRLATPGLLVVSEPAHPGWRATLDGAPVEWLTADYALMAVPVPAGDHTVRFVMTAPAVDAGLAAGAAGALLLAALAFARKRRIAVEETPAAASP